MNKTISLIDIDSMFYQAGNLPSLEECIVKFKEKLNNCLVETKCSHWAGFTSNGKTFRHHIFEGYKANRTQEPPKYLQALKAWAIAEYSLNVSIGYEADDAVAYWMNKKEWDISELPELCGIFDKIMCAIDKDLLQSIPGTHFNYSYRIKEESKSKPKELLTDNDFNKGWWIETIQEESDYFKAKQLLMGDSSDSVVGIPKIGESKAGNILKDFSNKDEYHMVILNRYISHYGLSQGIFEFQKNYRLLHMLDCDEDFFRECKQLPLFPHINTVEQKNEEIKIDIENVF